MKNGTAPIPENEVKRTCLEYLTLQGIYAWINNTGALPAGDKRFIRFGHPGSSDIIGILPGGRFLAVECKSNTGRLSEAQEEFLAAVRANGGLAVVARSYEDIAEALHGAGYIR
ncbi:MAG: VRR-NUC domain-containing protein [Treponema sp.]|jgi:hypothetical protein|nr:VRR-NUC domain-containing protein [Treponema sp.]